MKPVIIAVADILREKLPQEIRDMILEYTLTEKKAIQIIDKEGDYESSLSCSSTTKVWLDKSIVGSEAAEEAARAFYRVNKFCVGNSRALPWLSIPSDSNIPHLDTGFDKYISVLQVTVVPLERASSSKGKDADALLDSDLRTRHLKNDFIKRQHDVASSLCSI